MTHSDVHISTADVSHMDVRAFFRSLSNVPTPGPHDYTDVYTATVPITRVDTVSDDSIVVTNDDMPDRVVVGMAVVDTFAKPLLYGIGVTAAFQQDGVGKQLVNTCIANHDRLYARVRKDNDPAIALFESVDMERTESMWPNELWKYETADG